MSESPTGPDGETGLRGHGPSWAQGCEGLGPSPFPGSAPLNRADYVCSRVWPLDLTLQGLEWWLLPSLGPLAWLFLQIQHFTSFIHFFPADGTICVCVCGVCMCALCEGMYPCMCTCVCLSDQVSSLISLCLFLRQGLRLGWLADELRGSACLRPWSQHQS